MKRKGNPIGWCTDTWNPVVGCSHASPGCAHCYAETMAIRLAGTGIEKYQKATGPLYSGKNGWNHRCYLSESELEKPFHWKQPRRIFVSSMGDLFHENVPFEWIDRVMEVIRICGQHFFMILTKRPERMKGYFQSFQAKKILDFDFGNDSMVYVRNDGNEDAYVLGNVRGWPLPNLDLGVTAENQEMADKRIPILLDVPAAIRFVSIEPMLGPVDISKYLDSHWQDVLREFNGCGLARELINERLDWVICGGETGHGSRTFPGIAEVIVNIKDQCQKAGVPFFYKGPYGVDSYSERGNAHDKKYFLYRCEKSQLKLIEGIEYREFPEVK